MREKKLRILITGSTGQLGSFLIRCLQKWSSLEVIGTIRSDPCESGLRYLDLDNFGGFDRALSDIDIIIHCAAVTRPQSSIKYSSSHYSVNTISSLELFRAASRQKVKKFIFVSSAKIIGETTKFEIVDETHYRPEDSYARSKFLAEKLLLEKKKGSNTELIIIRPAMIYGEDFESSLDMIFKFLRMGIPLPFRGLKARRSIVYQYDLLADFEDLIWKVGQVEPEAFFSKSEDITVAELAILTGKILNRSWLVFWFPASILKQILVFLGATKLEQSLCEEFVVSECAISRSGVRRPRVSFSEVCGTVMRSRYD